MQASDSRQGKLVNSFPSIGEIVDQNVLSQTVRTGEEDPTFIDPGNSGDKSIIEIALTKHKCVDGDTLSSTGFHLS